MRPHLSWPAGGYMGLSEANPGPAELSIEPVKENILRCLFRSVQKVLLITARKKSVTNEQADTLASRFLLELAAGQVLSFLPGRLGGLNGLIIVKGALNMALRNYVAERAPVMALSLAKVGMRYRPTVRTRLGFAKIRFLLSNKVPKGSNSLVLLYYL